MKHLIPFRIYEARTTSDLTPDQEAFLTKYITGTWSVNPTTGLVDVRGDFSCKEEYIESLSDISFGHVSGDFNCDRNNLTSLEGAPQMVGGNFWCSSNKLTSLEGAPQTVNGDFYCYNNKLTSLEGLPQNVGGNFFCHQNRLTSLEGAPLTVNGDFLCSFNQLTSLEGAPQTVRGDFFCFNNELTFLEGSPRTVGGGFYCDLFSLKVGKWNMQGWAEVLNTGTDEAKKLILTLPELQPEYWNSKLKEKPKATILQIVPIWDDLPSNIRDEIQIPSNLKDSFDNLLDLERAGIF